MKRAIIFILFFASIFIGLYFYEMHRTVSTDRYKVINIKYSSVDTLGNESTEFYMFNLKDSVVNVYSKESTKIKKRKLNFYNDDFFQYIVKGINRREEVEKPSFKAKSFNITTIDTLQEKQFYYINQEKINQLIDNYFSI